VVVFFYARNHQRLSPNYFIPPVGGKPVENDQTRLFEKALLPAFLSIEKDRLNMVCGEQKCK